MKEIGTDMLWKYPQEEAARLPSLALAYVGDAVFELFIRCRLAAEEVKVKRMHRGAINLVSARAMAEYYKKLEPHLSTMENEVLHRGRNVKSRRSKSAGVSQYHMSTGFEALVGYLFLSGQEERLAYLLSLLIGEENGSTE